MIKDTFYIKWMVAEFIEQLKDSVECFILFESTKWAGTSVFENRQYNKNELIAICIPF